MDETKKPTPPPATNAGISLYQSQKEWLQQKAQEEATRTGIPHTRSKIVQKIITEAMKKDEKKGGK